MFKKIISYFTPVIDKKLSSKINNQLQLTWKKGKLTLDSKNTNYSYGELQNILRETLNYIGYHKIRSFERVLVLGLGAGGIIQTLRHDALYNNTIDSVELDPQIISIAKKYFQLNDFGENHHIHCMDAFEYVLRSNNKYGLVVIDIFIDYTMPDFLFEQYFIKHLLDIVDINGFIVFNTIVINKQQALRNKDFTKLFDPKKYSLRLYPGSKTANEVFLIKKLH